MNIGPQQTVIGKDQILLYDDVASTARGNARLLCRTVQATTYYLSADVFKIVTYDIMLVPVTKVGPGQMN